MGWVWLSEGSAWALHWPHLADVPRTLSNDTCQEISRDGNLDQGRDRGMSGSTLQKFAHLNENPSPMDPPAIVSSQRGFYGTGNEAYLHLRRVRMLPHAVYPSPCRLGELARLSSQYHGMRDRPPHTHTLEPEKKQLLMQEQERAQFRLILFLVTAGAHGQNTM